MYSLTRVLTLPAAKITSGIRKVVSMTNSDRDARRRPSCTVRPRATAALRRTGSPCLSVETEQDEQRNDEGSRRRHSAQPLAFAMRRFESPRTRTGQNVSAAQGQEGDDREKRQSSLMPPPTDIQVTSDGTTPMTIANGIVKDVARLGAAQRAG